MEVEDLYEDAVFVLTSRVTFQKARQRCSDAETKSDSNQSIYVDRRLSSGRWLAKNQFFRMAVDKGC